LSAIAKTVLELNGSSTQWGTVVNQLPATSGGVELGPMATMAEVEKTKLNNAAACVACHYNPIAWSGGRVPDGTTYGTMTWSSIIRVPVPILTDGGAAGAQRGFFQLGSSQKALYRTGATVSNGAITWNAWQDDPRLATMSTRLWCYRTVGCGAYLMFTGKPTDAAGVVYHLELTGSGSGLTPHLAYNNSTDITSNNPVVVPFNEDGLSFASQTTGVVHAFDNASTNTMWSWKLPSDNTTTSTVCSSYGWDLEFNIGATAGLSVLATIRVQYEGIMLPVERFLTPHYMIGDARDVLGDLETVVISMAGSNLNQSLALACAADQVFARHNGHTTGDSSMVYTMGGSSSPHLALLPHFDWNKAIGMGKKLWKNRGKVMQIGKEALAVGRDVYSGPELLAHYQAVVDFLAGQTPSVESPLILGFLREAGMKPPVPLSRALLEYKDGDSDSSDPPGSGFVDAVTGAPALSEQARVPSQFLRGYNVQQQPSITSAGRPRGL